MAAVSVTWRLADSKEWKLLSVVVTEFSITLPSSDVLQIELAASVATIRMKGIVNEKRVYVANVTMVAFSSLASTSFA